MKAKNIITVVAAISSLSLGCVYAGTLPISGRASVEYHPNEIGSRQTAGEEAQKEAVRNGLDSMISSQSEAIRQLYEERKPEIYLTLINLLNNVENSQKDNKETHSMEVTVSASIDEDVLKDTLMNSQATQKAVNLNDTQVALFFTARNVSSVIQHQGTIKADSSTSESSESAVAEAETTATLSSSESVTRKSTSETSSSKTLKSDVVEYQLDGPSREEFGSALSARMLDKGFENIVDGAMFDVSAEFDAAFAKGDVVPAAIWRKVVAAIREEEPSIEYLICGTLDIGTPRRDDMTGMWEVEATMTGKVYKLGNKIPRLVATLQPQTLKGKAPDQLQSKKRALAGIAPIAVDEMLAKLKSKNIIK